LSIKKAYDSWAKIYDSNENKTRDLDQQVTIDTLSKYSFTSILELGCGTGKNTQWLIQRAEKLIGFDFSKKMLAIAKKKVKSDSVRFEESDIKLNWNLSDDSVDLITASLTLEHIENLDHVFNQAYLKLHQSGIFFVCELHPIKQYLGSKARYETDKGSQELEVYTHHLSDYINAANKSGFEMIEINESFDETAEVPRLISFVFRK